MRAFSASALAVALFFLLVAPVGASPEDRMAGGNGSSDSTEAEAPSEASDPGKAVLPADFVRLESSGLLTSFRDGALGKDVWHSTRRSDLVPALTYAGPEIRSPQVTRLMLRLLLTKTDANLIANDSDPAPGEDIFTLRVLRLVEMGAHQKALDMYGLQKDAPYHPNLARAGALAMLGSGNAPLACLESRSMNERFTGIDFWNKLAALCATILPSADDTAAKAASGATDGSKILEKISAGETFRVPFDKGTQFNDFSPLERSALFGLGRVDYGSLSSVRFDALSAEVLGLMLHDQKLPEDWRYAAGVEALGRGLREIDVISPLYDDAVKAGAGAGKDPDSFSQWTDLPALYAAAANAALGDQQWTYLVRAFQVTPKDKGAALLPFAKLLQEARPPADASSYFIVRGGELIVRSGRDLAQPWTDRLDTIAESADEEWSGNAALILIASDILKNTGDFSGTISRYSGKLKPEELASVAQMPQALDISNANALETIAPYEKGAGLTFGKDYVMPSVILMDYLDQAIKQKTLGGVILFSAIAFENMEPAEMFPGMLRTVVTGYRTVGLNNEARTIATEAVLGQIGE